MFVRTGAGVGLAALLCSGTALAQKYDGSGAPSFIPHTLQEAFASAYLTNPQLQAERANLRVTDENVPTALAGWRPTITGTTGLTYTQGTVQQGTGLGGVIATPGYTAGVTIQQPIYQGGHTTALTHEAVNRVLAERANLIATEQTVFSNVVSAYVGVIQNQQNLQIQTNNERVLVQQLQATQDRFRVGEITRTDVAQAQAALATARAQRQQAEGQLQTAEATYEQQVGMPPAPNLIPPQPLDLPVHTEQEAMAQAVSNNPSVVAALFTQSSDKDAFDVAVSALLPKITAQAEYLHGVNQTFKGYQEDIKEAILNFQVPIYQGGAEYAAARQARQTEQYARRQVDVQRKTALQSAISNWENLLAFRASIQSDRTAVRANIIALDGVERQVIVGTSTTLALLQQQQTLLSSQLALVQSLSSMVTASYSVASAIGRLTARDLKLNVPLYDETAYYKAVKDRLWGLNDYAVGQPGR
ncbi:TolC family outer membrane protein [Lichenicoccus sp.]|uniref:TolC family outer membrane protein n=1 Tax=Lichenicoccus sp. TaxID=2781899 RepID=UPI003D0C876C